MAWPVDTSEEIDPPIESRNVQGAVGFSHIIGRRYQNALPHAQNLEAAGENSISNPHIRRIRNGRRYSSGDINQSNERRTLRVDQVSSVQRPCCHNPNVRLSCCYHMNRHMSLEGCELHSRRNSYPQNPLSHYFSQDNVNYRRNSTWTVFNGNRLFSNNENTAHIDALNIERERRRSSSSNESFVFTRENSVEDWNWQKALSDFRVEFFLRFLADQMDQRELQLPEDMHVRCCSPLPQSFYYLIDRFSVSLEREMVSSLALRVQLPLNFNSFVSILDGLHEGTASPEYVITLFFFCGDLAIRAMYENNDTHFREIVTWTERYLRGLDVLVPMKKPSYKIAATACIVGIVAILVIMKWS